MMPRIAKTFRYRNIYIAKEIDEEKINKENNRRISKEMMKYEEYVEVEK